MRMSSSGRRDCPFHRSLGIAFVGAALVCGQSAALTVGELSFFEFGHSAMPTEFSVKVTGSAASFRSRRTSFAMPLPE